LSRGIERAIGKRGPKGGLLRGIPKREIVALGARILRLRLP